MYDSSLCAASVRRENRLNASEIQVVRFFLTALQEAQGHNIQPEPPLRIQFSYTNVYRCDARQTKAYFRIFQPIRRHSNISSMSRHALRINYACNTLVYFKQSSCRQQAYRPIHKKRIRFHYFFDNLHNICRSMHDFDLN